MDSESAKFSEEIIIEILLRLPVKALLRFKSVCKSWKFIISDSYFIRRHLDHMKNHRYHHHHLLYYNHGSTQPKAVSIHTLALANSNSINGGTTSTSSIVKPDEMLVLQQKDEKEESASVFRSLGSCNGLVLLEKVSLSSSRKSTLFLWNPSTREIKILPDSGQSIRKACETNRGLGYDSLSNDYKVVQISFDLKCKSSQVWLYSLRANSWRRIQDIQYEVGGPRDASLIGEHCLVWFGFTATNLVSFDLSNETFQELVLPPNEYATPAVSVGSLNGHLSIIYTSLQAVEVWVMKDYGVNGSWSKWFSLPFPKDVEGLPDRYGRPSSILRLKPLCILSNGEIAMVYVKGVIFYRLVDGIYTYRNVVFSDSFVHPNQIYVESLVSTNVVE